MTKFKKVIDHLDNYTWELNAKYNASNSYGKSEQKIAEERKEHKETLEQFRKAINLLSANE